MTEEQIKQNAEKYASENYHPYGSETNPQYLTVSEDSFIAGAHSRDEEIEELRKHDALENKMRIDLINECEKLKQELDNLRNPWISVNDRLPEKNCKVLVAGGEYDIAIYRAASHKFYTAYKELQKKIGEKSDVGSYMIGGDCVQTEEYFSRGEREDITETVTHWMPIPELQKGE